MGVMYWVRVGMMVLTLAFTIMAIRNLQQGRPAISPLTKLFFDGSNSGSNVILCPTRVQKLESASGLRLQQDKMKWMRQDQSHPAQEVDTIAVEKWFGRNCSIPVQKTSTPAASYYQPILRLDYVSGASLYLQRSAAGEYLWQGERFVSKALDEALRDLALLPTEDQKPAAK